jgi:hypothetical protein
MSEEKTDQCDEVLEAAKGKLETCWVIGIAKDGSSYLGSRISSKSDLSDLIWLLEKCKEELIDEDKK